MALKVWYVDDEKALCEIFIDFFESKEIEVRAFNDPEKAILAAKTTRPDLVFIDYRLPNTNGDIVAQALNPNIPKFLITGDPSIQTNYKFLKVFDKPFKEEDVREVLEGYLNPK